MLGGMTPPPPIALVIWMSIRNIPVVARLIPMPYAAPPRLVLVASGAPKIAMIKHVMGMAILSARATLSSFASPPERSSAAMKRLSSE
jgi:hypothetical protein